MVVMPLRPEQRGARPRARNTSSNRMSCCQCSDPMVVMPLRPEQRGLETTFEHKSCKEKRAC